MSGSLLKELMNIVAKGEEVQEDATQSDIKFKLVDPLGSSLQEIVISNSPHNPDVISIFDAREPNMKIKFHASGVDQIIRGLQYAQKRVGR